MNIHDKSLAGRLVLCLALLVVLFSGPATAPTAAASTVSKDLPLWLSFDPALSGRFLGRMEVRAAVQALEQMKARDEITDYLLQSQEGGIQVFGAAREEAFYGLAGVQSARRETPGTCHSARAVAAAGADSEGTDYQVKGPLEVYLDWATDIRTRYIRGQVTPNTPLELRIWHAGQLIYSTPGMSDARGRYEFSPQYYDTCGVRAGLWVAYPGDLVQLQAGEATYATTVIDLPAWMDTQANWIEGRVPAGRAVEVQVERPGPNCGLDGSTWDWYTAAPQADGRFSISPGDLTYDGLVEVYAREGGTPAGPGTYTAVPPVQFNLASASDITGQFLPYTAYTLRWERGAELLESRAGQTGNVGFFSAYFPSPPQPGDRLVMEGGGRAMDYTVTSLSASFDPAASEITGTALPGYHLDFRYVQTRAGSECDVPNACHRATADAQGHFRLAVAENWPSGFGYSWNSVDERGSYQNGPSMRQPWVAFEGYEILGAAFPDQAPVTVRWEDGDGNLLSTGSTQTDTDGRFRSPDFPAPPGRARPQAGDRFKVSVGEIQRTATFPLLDLRLSSKTSRLGGQVSAGWLDAWLLADDYENGGMNTYCASLATNQAGPVQMPFPDGSIKGGSSAFIVFIDQEHIQTTLWLDAFFVRAELGSKEVFAYIEKGLGTNTAELWRGGKLLASTSSDWTYGWSHPAWFTLSTPVQPGDRLVVTGSDGNTADILLPALEAHGGPLPRQVTGQSPANRPVYVNVSNPDGFQNLGYRGISGRAVAGADGTFTLDLSGRYWNAEDCLGFQAGDPCNRYDLVYHTPEGYVVLWHGPYPSPAAPDAYEPDDTPETASIYSEPQAHTQHQDDVVDWVSFDVSQASISSGQLHVFEISQVGIQSGIRGDILTPDGQTIPLGGEVSLMHTLRVTHFFTQPGTYRLALYPQAPYSTGACYAHYRLSIVTLPTVPIFLPLIGR